MDVDLLRPGTVPISPDTVLWFEFLLKPDLLKHHLSKLTPDPSPTDLIIKFSSIMPNPPTEPPKITDLENPSSPTLCIVEIEKYSKKHLALKVLCLKIAAALRWNLPILETKLPIHIQSQLMQDLVYMTTDGTHNIPPHDASEEYLQRPGIKFSFILYHRWFIRALVNRALYTRTIKPGVTNVGIAPSENSYMQMSMNYEGIFSQPEEARRYSLQFLSELVENRTKSSQAKPYKNAYQSVKIPVHDTFAVLTEDSTEMVHNWDIDEVVVSENELFMQINFDLCYNYFFYGQYDLAKKHIILCNEHKERLVKEKHPKESVHRSGFNWSRMEYASVSEEEIHGYMKALNISQKKTSLLSQLHEAVANNYEGLLKVLEVDNIVREIPMVHRNIVELDIQGVSSSGTATVSRDLLNKVVALNIVRSLLEGNLPSVHVDFNNRMNTIPKFIDTIFWALELVLKSDRLDDRDKHLIKQFFTHLTMSDYGMSMIDIFNNLKKLKGGEGCDDEYVRKLFDDEEIEEFIKDSASDRDLDVNLSEELMNLGWDTHDLNLKNIPELEVGCLRQRLIDATTADKIRECLVDLAHTNPVQPLWTVNPQWKLPIPLHNVIMNLQRSFIQDFSYITLGKARQHAEMGDHAAALELLVILENETRNKWNQSSNSNSPTNSAMYKLSKLVGWEALFMQMQQVLSEWPFHKVNMPSLMCKATLCILANQPGEGVIPRMEIVEQCFICLLNGGEWKQLGDLSLKTRISGQAEAAVATAMAVHHLRTKPTKKLPEDLWDMVYPIFVVVHSSSSSTKRNSSGNPVSSSSRDLSMNNKMKDGMTSFFSKLRDPIVLSVVISLLAKLFNIQKDDSNMDLSMDYINLWPAKVNCTISLSSVSSTLYQLVTQALKYYPNNISWIKLLGDMSLVGGHYAIAMKQYLTALTILSDNFTQPLSKQLVEDQTIYKRMIKCCTQLNCPTQAAVLCQFLEEIDYVLAFKCLSEMTHLCSDAMDSYYGCIWDTSILEYLINLHHKRGETHRKQLAVKVMGLLELNANNSEEIQREAANKRKAKFMRALVKQYVC